MFWMYANFLANTMQPKPQNQGFFGSFTSKNV